MDRDNLKGMILEKLSRITKYIQDDEPVEEDGVVMNVDNLSNIDDELDNIVGNWEY